MNWNPEELPQIFQDWKAHPMTQELFKILRKRVEDRKADWAQGHFDASFSTEYIARNSVAKGYVNACEDILNIDIEDLSE